jgi:hypothetical protein
MVSCLTRLSEEADGWLTGNPLDWLRWLKGSNGYRMEMGGDAQVARHVANGLRGDLLDRPRVLVTSDEAR